MSGASIGQKPPPADLPGSALERFYRRTAAHAESLAARDVATAVDWVLRHGLLALSGRVGGPLRERLEAARTANLVANRALIWHFQDLVDALDGVPVCPLKGVALLETAYRDRLEDRMLWDLDLLVPRERLDEAVRRLEQIGYAEDEATRGLREIGYHRCLQRNRKQVEVHRTLGDAFWHGMDWKALRPRPARIHDRHVYALDPATTLVHLLVHLVHHGPFHKLKWIEDILSLEADGAAAWRRAGELGVALPVAAAARVLRRWLGGEVLPGIGAGGGWRTLAMERLVWRFRGDPLAGGPSTALARNAAAVLLDSADGAVVYTVNKVRELLRRRWG